MFMSLSAFRNYLLSACLMINTKHYYLVWNDLFSPIKVNVQGVPKNRRLERRFEDFYGHFRKNKRSLHLKQKCEKLVWCSLNFIESFNQGLDYLLDRTHIRLMFSGNPCMRICASLYRLKNTTSFKLARLQSTK